MTRGKFIAFEGGEGAGKSTQARLLAQALTARGIACTVTREPGGTPGAEALLFAAARSDHVERLIEPALAQGDWVICDRFVDSSRAYQGGAGGLPDDDIIDLHELGSGGLLPDLTVLIELAPAAAAERTRARDGDAADRIGGRDAAYHARVAATFAQLAHAEPWRFARIDGNAAADAVHDLVVAALQPLLGRT